MRDTITLHRGKLPREPRSFKVHSGGLLKGPQQWWVSLALLAAMVCTGSGGISSTNITKVMVSNATFQAPSRRGLRVLTLNTDRGYAPTL